MKRFLTLALAVASVGFIAVGTASAIDTYVDGDAANGIGNSRHNLGNLGEHIRTNSTSEICVFCHTPHHTNTANNLKPLWNRGTSAPASFTAYGSTIAGTSIASTDIGSTSLACLSCHDGVTTFDNLVNAPGKSGVVNNGSDRGWTFSDVGLPASDFMTSSRLNIGLNLSNDHPVSVVYNANAAGLRPTNTVIAAIDLTADLAVSSATVDNGNMLKNLWAVKGYVDDAATIADLLRSDKVECSSCHDPHFNNKSWNEIDGTYATLTEEQEPENNGLFLRRVGGNSGSGLCRTCHNK
jgi:cytochrome c553